MTTMASRKQRQLEGQAPLFVGGDGNAHEYESPSVTTWQQLEDGSLPEAPAVQPDNVGVYVDLRERAQHLDAALAAVGQRNSREGFGIGARVRPHSTEIWGRYQDATPTVIEGAERNADAFAEVIKREFWHATGYAALRGTGLMREEVIERYATKDWKDFVDRFDHPNNSKARTKFRRGLKKVINSPNSSTKAA